MVILVLSHLCNVRSVTGKGLILCSALGEAVNCLIPRDARMRTHMRHAHFVVAAPRRFAAGAVT